MKRAFSLAFCAVLSILLAGYETPIAGVSGPKAIEQTDLYFVRHGETLANSTGHYNGRTINTFSPLGEKEVASLPSRLAGVHFSTVICSPSPRALRTALPVLKAQHLEGVIWPEFNECCTQVGKARLVPAHSNSLRTVGPIRVALDLSPFFKVVIGHDQMIADGNYQDGLKVTQECVARFKKEFQGSGQRILVVGHSGQGGVFLDSLLSPASKRKVRIGNTSIFHLRELGGVWTLVSVSDYKPARG